MSNLSVRVLVAVIGIPLIFFVTIQGKLFFFGFIALISILATFEYYRLVGRKNASPFAFIGYVAILLIDVIFYIGKVEYFTPLVILTVLLLGLIELFRSPKFSGWSSISNFATALFPVFYIGLSLGTLIGLREDKFKWSDYFEGGLFIFLLFATIWICDTAAYFIGKSFGNKKLYERISPNKTVEGFVGGLAFAIIFSFVIKYLFFNNLTEFDAVVIGLIVGILGQLGDLVESSFKRDAGVKDSSSIIPGHGGVFDRFDSLIYVAPFVYLYFTLFK